MRITDDERYAIIATFVLQAKERATQIILEGGGIKGAFERAVDELLVAPKPVPPEVSKRKRNKTHE